MKEIAIYSLETTNNCQLNCSFCPLAYSWSDREKGFLNPEMITILNDQGAFKYTRYIEVQLGGEPTLHPRLAEIIHRLKNLGLKVGMSTNGIIQDFDYSILDIVTTTRDREREWKVKGDNVYFQSLGEDYPYEDYSHKQPINNPIVKECTTPFTHVSVHWDGDVVPCCKCNGKQHVFGNLFDMPWEEILNSRKRNEFLADLTRNYICSYCETPNPHLIHQRIIEKVNP